MRRRFLPGIPAAQAFPAAALDEAPPLEPAAVDQGNATAALSIGTVRVAYHRGPPAITFWGRRWLRARPIEIPEQEWIAMQQRPEFAAFDFRNA